MISLSMVENIRIPMLDFSDEKGDYEKFTRSPQNKCFPPKQLCSSPQELFQDVLTDEHMISFPFLPTKKQIQHPHAGAQTLNQIPKGGEGIRSQIENRVGHDCLQSKTGLSMCPMTKYV